MEPIDWKNKVFQTISDAFWYSNYPLKIVSRMMILNLPKYIDNFCILLGLKKY